jgi:hypothetical protein
MSADHSLAALTRKLDGPLDIVTTTQCEAARMVLANRGLTDLEAMLRIDDEGLVDGVARGLCVEA